MMLTADLNFILTEPGLANNAGLLIAGVLVGLVSAALLGVGIWLLAKKDPPQTSLWEDLEKLNKDEF